MKFITLGLVSIILLSCNKKEETMPISKENITQSSISTEPKTSLNPTDLKFAENVVDLGNIKTVDTLLVAHYTFKNTGNSPLLIEYINPDCSCTDYEYSKDTIPVNGDGFINLKFDTKNKVGPQKVYAVVKANTKDKFYRLLLKVNLN